MNRIKKILLLIMLILLMGTSYSQTYIRKIELYVIPLTVQTKYKLAYNEVKKNSYIKITIKNTLGPKSLNDFFQMIDNIKYDKSICIVEDYRIMCVVHKLIGKEKLYFNSYGDFLYNNRMYSNEEVRLFVLDHIPESCK